MQTLSLHTLNRWVIDYRCFEDRSKCFLQAVNMFMLIWESMGTDSLLPMLDTRGTIGRWKKWAFEAFHFETPGARTTWWVSSWTFDSQPSSPHVHVEMLLIRSVASHSTNCFFTVKTSKHIWIPDIPQVWLIGHNLSRCLQLWMWGVSVSSKWIQTPGPK